MLEAHPREKSIIVNYKLEAAVYGDGDVVDPMLADKKVRKHSSSGNETATTYRQGLWLAFGLFNAITTA